jgi:hypothetical protein
MRRKSVLVVVGILVGLLVLALLGVGMVVAQPLAVGNALALTGPAVA